MNTKLEKVYSFVQDFSEHTKKLGKYERMSTSYRECASLEDLNRIIEGYLEFTISKNPMDLVEPELLSEFYLKTSKLYPPEGSFTEMQYYNFGSRAIANEYETIKHLYGFLVMLTLEGSGFAPDSELYEELSFSLYWSQYKDLLGYIENRKKILYEMPIYNGYVPNLANSVVEILSGGYAPLIASESMKDAVKNSMYMAWTFSKKVQSMECQAKTFHNLNRGSKTRLLSALLSNYFSTNSFVGVARVMNFLDNVVSFNTEDFSLNSDEISRSYLEKFLNLIIELKYSEYSKEELPQPSLTYILAISNGMSEGFAAISPNTEVVTEVFQEGGNLYAEFMYELFDIEDKYRDNSKTYNFNFLEGLDLPKILETEKGQKMFEVMMGICYGSVRTYREPVPGSVHLNFRNYSSVEDEDLDELLIPLREALIKVLDKVGSY